MKMLKKLLEKNGFSIKMSRGFLMTPFKVNILEALERRLKNSKPDFTFLMNQIVVGEKSS